MSRKKTKAVEATRILLIAAVFIAVLAVSIVVQLSLSPNFQGFGRDNVSGPGENTQQGEDAAEEGDGSFNWKKHPVFIIGDSLTYGARHEIAKVVENSTIDSKEGRNMATGVQILKDWIDSGLLAEDAIVIICLANNITDSTSKDAQTIVDMIEPGQSLIMMTGHGLASMEPANEFIRTLPNLYAFVTVADWDLTIAQSPSLLSGDGIHVAGSQGNVLYADLIVRALEVSKPRP